MSLPSHDTHPPRYFESMSISETPNTREYQWVVTTPTSAAESGNITGLKIISTDNQSSPVNRFDLPVM